MSHGRADTSVADSFTIAGNVRQDLGLSRQGNTTMKRFQIALIAITALPACQSGQISKSGADNSGPRSIQTENLNVEYRDITDAQAETFARKAEKAHGYVTAFLGVAYGNKIQIKIGNGYRIPRASRSGRITIPANRIRGDAGGAARIRGRGPAIAHEITHVVAPSRFKPNRYLDEGLGVYVQEKFENEKSVRDEFGIVRTYPNMGDDLHQATARMISAYGARIPLKDVEKVRRSRRGGLGRSLAYLQEGSFVRFLIETYGLEKFMAMYRGKSYEEVYDKTLAGLEKEWASFVGRI